MAVNQSPSTRLRPVGVVLVIIALQLSAAWVLDQAADKNVGLALAIGVIVFAIGLNLIRFVVWGYAHKHYPLSHIYPLTALFFPCILLLAYVKGDSIDVTQIVGTIVITIGAVIMSAHKKERASSHD